MSDVLMYFALAIAVGSLIAAGVLVVRGMFEF